MCDSCGCNITPGNRHLVAEGEPGHQAIDVLQHLLSANDHAAAHNREHFDRHGVLAYNLMSSPGSGKTALLEATIEALGDRYRIAVIEGDLETENDADRIPVMPSGDSVILVETNMAYEPIFNIGLKAQWYTTFITTRPRFTSCVKYDLNDGSTLPACIYDSDVDMSDNVSDDNTGDITIDPDNT